MIAGGPAGIDSGTVRPGSGAPRLLMTKPTPALTSTFATQPGAPRKPRSRPVGLCGRLARVTKHRPRLVPVTFAVVRFTVVPRNGFALADSASGGWSKPDVANGSDAVMSIEPGSAAPFPVVKPTMHPTRPPPSRPIVAQRISTLPPGRNTIWNVLSCVPTAKSGTLSHVNTCALLAASKS